jgi:putative transcriptional regulator
LASIEHIESGQYRELKTVQVPYPTSVRLKLGVSQSEFARLLRVPKRTIQEWGQDRRKPTGAAMALLKVVEQAPDLVKTILADNGSDASHRAA